MLKSETLNLFKCYSFLVHRGTSSNGRALASHARGTGIDAPVLHFSFLVEQTTMRTTIHRSSYDPLCHVRMAERSKAPDSREKPLSLTGVFWSTDVGVGSNPTSDNIFIQTF